MASSNSRRASPKRLIAWTIKERNGEAYWTKIGAAFTNKDGSQTIILDALPLNGEIVLREPKPPAEPA